MIVSKLTFIDPSGENTREIQLTVEESECLLRAVKTAYLESKSQQSKVFSIVGMPPVVRDAITQAIKVTRGLYLKLQEGRV